MSIIAKSKGISFEKFPAGLVQAVCCGVHDIGLQKTTHNKETKIKHQVVIIWETKHIFKDKESEFFGKRRKISKTYTLSFSEKANLRKDIESWFSKSFDEETARTGFDVEKLIGYNCNLTITHKDQYANITSISPMMEGQEKMLIEGDTSAPKWVIEKKEKSVNEDISDFNFDEKDPFSI